MEAGNSAKSREELSMVSSSWTCSGDLGRGHQAEELLNPTCASGHEVEAILGSHLAQSIAKQEVDSARSSCNMTQKAILKPEWPWLHVNIFKTWQDALPGPETQRYLLWCAVALA